MLRKAIDTAGLSDCHIAMTVLVVEHLSTKAAVAEPTTGR